jgi:hypothetical protein
MVHSKAEYLLDLCIGTVDPSPLARHRPDSVRDIPTTRRPTRITPPAPSLSQTGGSGGSLAGIPTSASYAAPFLPSLNLQLATSHRTLSNVFSFIADTISYTNTNIPISSCDDLVSTTGTWPLNPALRYPGAIRGPHAEHTRHRHRWWAGPSRPA